MTDTMNPDFTKSPDGLLPAIVQDAQTGVVLMLGYFNAEALAVTQSTGRVTFFSRSKQRLWTKGESSGHYLLLHNLSLDCDQDTFLVKVTPQGPTCHTGADTCWNETNEPLSFLHVLEGIICDRRDNAPPGSYTAKLFAAGTHKIAQKVGEEAVETVIEALRDDRPRLLEEVADLTYHLLVLLADRKVALSEVETVLRNRHR